MMKVLFVAALAVASTLPALAASPWDGSWKLDASKSHLAGASFTYSKSANGMWHFSDGGAYAYDFAPDGKPYNLPTTGDTQVTTKDGEHAIVMVFAHDGKTMSTMHEELSADGKTLTDHTTGTHPDGTKIDSTSMSTRVSGGPGFLGTWKSTKVENPPSSGYMLSVAGDSIVWDITSDKMKVAGKMDGSDLPITGPTASTNMTLSIKKATSNKFDYWVKLNGKPMVGGNMVLSADGKWLTDTSWTVGKESEKTIAVYMK